MIVEFDIPDDAPVAVVQELLATQGLTLKPQGNRYRLTRLAKAPTRIATKKENAPCPKN